MDNIPEDKKPKPFKPSSFCSIRVRKETRKRILSELAKVNRKDFGKRVHADELIALAMGFITPVHVKNLQEGSLSNTDCLERDYCAYVAKHGPISKDAYLGKRLSGEISAQTLSSKPGIEPAQS